MDSPSRFFQSPCREGRSDTNSWSNAVYHQQRQNVSPATLRMDEFRPDASFFEPRAGLGTFNHHKQHPYAHDVQPTPFGPHQHQYVPEYSMHQSLYEAPHHGHANQTIMHTSSYDLHHYHPQFASQWRPSSGFLFPVSGGDANTNRRYPDHSYSSWHTMPVEYVTDPQPTDVLSGRGGATNSHSGNRAFRSLVKEYQQDYLKAKKQNKPHVAAIVVQKVRAKGGRFLRRYSASQQGVVWVDIGDEKAQEKAAQALREGAPERKKKRGGQVGSFSSQKDSSTSISASSVCDRTCSESEESSSKVPSRNTKSRPAIFQFGTEESETDPSGPIVIKPSMALIRKSFEKPIILPLDELDSKDRELYLNFFLPPNAATRQQTAGSPPPVSAFDVTGSYTTKKKLPKDEARGPSGYAGRFASV